ncbi:unnamed protein product [Penicillium viridicatum]
MQVYWGMGSREEIPLLLTTTTIRICSATPVASSTRSISGAKMQQTKRAKQAGKKGLPEDGALQRFTSGTWVVLKPSGFSPSEDSFLAVVNGVSNALKALPEPELSGPKHVEIQKKLWMVELHSIEAARRKTHHKFGDQRTGPFKVVRVLPNAYELALSPTWTVHPSDHRRTLGAPSKDGGPL